MGRTTNAHIRSIFAVVAAATLAVAIIVWLMGVRVSDANETLVESQRTRIKLSDVLASISNAETGQRGFLLTGDERYLVPYVEGISQIPGRLDSLEQAAADGFLDRSVVTRVRDLCNILLARLQETLDVFRASGREAAVAEIRTDAGRQTMQEIREAIVRLESEQAANAEALRRVRERASAVRTVTIIAGGLVMLSFLIWAYRRLARDIEQRERNEAQLAEGRQRLEGIVASAMDAIVSIDEQQNIVLFNATAERVFGFRAADVLGTPLDRLIPDRYRTVHRHHVHQFGETGQTTRTMGAAHMNLSGLRADGSEFPIDASISQVEVSGRKIYTAILRDITDRRKAEEELLALHADLERRVEERTAELAEANRELEAFGYSVSHDLRAPLRHVTGFVELLEKHAADSLDDKARRYLKTIHEASRRMGHLIDDLLTLSRIGRATLSEVEVDLREMVDETRAQLADQTAGRQIEWRIGELPVVQGDPSLLRNVVMNLLTNAIKYSRTREAAVIEIGCRKENDEFICFFRDNGVGFDMQFVDKLFGVFQRLHRPEQFEGTGIGLASVRRIIQKHGGRTWAEGAVNQGATFYFSLPARE